MIKKISAVFYLSLIAVISIAYTRDLQKATHAKTVLVEYSYGNQIFGSGVKIFSDGSVQHEERSCCPPHSDPVKESNLDPAKLKDLKQWIQDASGAELAKEAGGPTAEGSESGWDYAYKNGHPFTVRLIERNQHVGGLDIISYNVAPSAQKIRDLVESYALNKMPQ